MNKIRRLIRDSFPGYEFGHIVEYHKSGRQVRKINNKPIHRFNQEYIYKKIKAIGASKIGIMMHNQQLQKSQFTEILICTQNPTL